MDDLTPGPIDPILRFVNVTWLWIVIEIVQLVFVDQIWYRFIGEYPESQFLDMCVIAKISVFILDERYHGYYMHCRSPHEHADANMVEIDKNLAKMRDNLVVNDPMQGVTTDSDGNPDFNVFEVNITRPWREHYDAIYRKVKASAKSKDASKATALKFKTRKQVNKFLQAFVDNPQDTEYPRRNMDNYFINSHLRVPPPEEVNNSILIGDKYNRFTSTLFLGVELDLALFNILTWAVVDLWVGDDTGNNHVLAAFITHIQLDYYLH